MLLNDVLHFNKGSVSVSTIAFLQEHPFGVINVETYYDKIYIL